MSRLSSLAGLSPSSITWDRQHGHPGQNGYVELKRGSTLLMKTTTSFDSAGRPGTVARENGDTWTYGYSSGSSRIHTVGVSGSGVTAHTAVREYDSLGRVKSIRYQRGNSSATWASNRLLGWTYGYKATSPYQRETAEPYAPTGSTAGVDEPPGWIYAYNLRGEVTGAVRSDRAGAVAGQEWGYSYDAIGNRLAAARGSSPGPVRTTTYTSNGTNAYTQVAGPGAVEISGMTAAGVARVAVNGLPTSGRPAGNGEPYGFSQWLTGQSGTSWLTVAVEATRPGEPPTNVPLEMLQEGRVWVPGTVSPQLDADGNLLFDGRWTYTWDGENRLIAMETAAAVFTMAGAPPKKRLEFAYDGQSRRLGKVVKQWQAAAQQWVVTGHWIYLHDGWNLVAELDVLRGGALARTYAWGTDLSGSGQGAGGVGGLLGVQVHHGAQGRYSVCTEVNGNVMGLVEATSGQLAGRFDYDAFGERITDAGVGSAVCPIGFSTKYTDAETGLCYYGYRYYDAVRGRWINRDPIGEEGGANLYGMVGNNLVNSFDGLGLVDGLMLLHTLKVRAAQGAATEAFAPVASSIATPGLTGAAMTTGGAVPLIGPLILLGLTLSLSDWHAEAPEGVLVDSTLPEYLIQSLPQSSYYDLHDLHADPERRRCACPTLPRGAGLVIYEGIYNERGLAVSGLITAGWKMGKPFSKKPSWWGSLPQNDVQQWEKGHLLSEALGGSGGFENLAAQTLRTNRSSVKKEYEIKMQKWVNAGRTVCFRIAPLYAALEDLYPVSISFVVWTNNVADKPLIDFVNQKFK